MDAKHIVSFQRRIDPTAPYLDRGRWQRAHRRLIRKIDDPIHSLQMRRKPIDMASAIVAAQKTVLTNRSHLITESRESGRCEDHRYCQCGNGLKLRKIPFMSIKVAQ